MCRPVDLRLHQERQQLSLERSSHTSLRIFLEPRREFFSSRRRICIVPPGDASKAPSSLYYLILLLLFLASLALTPCPFGGPLKIHLIRPLRTHLHSHHHLDHRYNYLQHLKVLVHRRSHHRYCYRTVTYHMVVLRPSHRHLEPFWAPAYLLAAINFDPVLVLHWITYPFLGLEHLDAWSLQVRCCCSDCYGSVRYYA